MSRKSYGQMYNPVYYRRLRISPAKMLMRYRALLQSGIDQIWPSWKARIESWNITVQLEKDNDDKVFKPAKLGGNIVVVFYVHSCLLTIGMVAYVYECWKGGKLSLQIIIDFSTSFLKYLFKRRGYKLKLRRIRQRKNQSKRKTVETVIRNFQKRRIFK